MQWVIARLDADIGPGFDALRAEASSQGFNFLDRLAQRWRGDAYDDDGNATLRGLIADDRLIAIGAQTYDEYDPHPDHRRLRHFYVADAWRRRRIGKALASALVEDAFSIAPRLHLRATRPWSIAFWEAMSFTPVVRTDRTHEKVRA
jgi:GNAT superfamily N-acetyltransferase